MKYNLDFDSEAPTYGDLMITSLTGGTACELVTRAYHRVVDRVES